MSPCLRGEKAKVGYYPRETPPVLSPANHHARALPARTNFPQVRPRIDSQIVPVVPGELQRIFAHGLSRQRLHRRPIHRQSSRRRLRRLARLSSGFPPLLVAQRARASIPQVGKRINRPVPILPLNLHSRPRSQVNHHRPRIVRRKSVPHPRRRIRRRHKPQYRMRPSVRPRTPFAPAPSSRNCAPGIEIPRSALDDKRIDDRSQILPRTKLGSCIAERNCAETLRRGCYLLLGTEHQ